MRFKHLSFLLIPLLFVSLSYGDVSKGLVGKEDIKTWDGKTQTFTRQSSSGRQLTMHKIDWQGVDVLQVYGGGTNRTDATISDALKSIGTTNKVSIFLSPGQWTFDENIDWSSYTNVFFNIPPGTTISHGTYTLNIPNVMAGPYQWTSGTGAITFSGNVHTFYPEWWGIDGTADEVQINYATAAATLAGGTVQLQHKTYTIAATINVYDAVHLKGAGDAYNDTTPNGTRISNGANVPAITVSGATGYGFKLSDFHIIGNSGTDDGIYLVQSGGSVPRTAKIYNISMDEIGRDGVRIDGASYVEFNNVSVDNAGANGFNILDVTSSPLQEFINLINCRTTSATTAGLSITSGANLQIHRCNFDAGSVGVFISGDPFEIHFSDLTISGATTYSIELNADDGYLARMFFRDTYIFLPGASANERAIYIHQTGGYGTTDTSFYNVDIAKSGATAPTYSIQVADTFLRSELLNVKDAANGNAYSVSLPTDQTFEYTSYYQKGVTALANDATPSVAGGSFFVTGGTTTITDFDDGYNGQVITILAQHSLTITDGTNIFLNGSANFDMVSSDTLTLRCYSDNKWYEVARSDNT